MTPEIAEKLERTTMEMVVQAVTDYREQATCIFLEESDLAQDIAEDVMREAVESMGIAGLPERLYGKVDYKKAVYVFIPEAYPVALMLDTKAEEGNGSATIQMSQTSMRVQYVNSKDGSVVDETGRLLSEIKRNGRVLYGVLVICKFIYKEPEPSKYHLQNIILACIPNAILQDAYNPKPEDTIWRAGRQAPTHGEDFRVRLSFARLKEKAVWRVRYL